MGCAFHITGRRRESRAFHWDTVLTSTMPLAARLNSPTCKGTLTSMLASLDYTSESASLAISL
jgi:hypothetical protein